MKTGRSRKLLVIFLLLVTTLLIAAPAFTEDNPSPTIYLRPGVRFGSDDRTITSFDVLVPFWQGEKNILFFNPRYSFDNRDGSEVNFGFGYRHLLFSDKAVLGINGYYDCRWTGWGTRHEQVGLGAEVMTDWVTGRFNGYFPVTGPQIDAAGGASGYYYFRDVGIYTGIGSLEETLGGFDGEVGFKVPYLSKYLETWVYAGGYHFEGDYVKDVDGFSSRVEVVPTDFLRIGFEYRNDTLNGNQYFGEAAVTVPFSIENLVKGKNPFEGIGSHIGGDRTLKERLAEPVRRDVDVRLHVAGAGPGLPGTETLVEDVVFVSEGAADGAGSGTFEDPFASIAEAVAAMHSGGIYSGITTIHVMDDGGDYAGGGTADITSLVVWGSGMPHPVYGYIQNQYLTSPTIYELNITADNVEIFGGTFVDAYGIVSSGTNTSIHDNIFTGNSSAGVYSTGGSATIFGNVFIGATYGINLGGGTATISGNTIANTLYGVYGDGGEAAVTGNEFLGDAYGIWINNGNFTITDNIIGTEANPIISIGIYASGSDAGLSDVSGNTIVINSSDSSVYGIYINNLAAGLILGANDITVTNTGGNAYGIYEYSDSDIYGSITGGSITANGSSGACGICLASTGGIGGSSIPFTITGAMIDAASTGGYAYGIYGGSSGDLYAGIIGGTIGATGASDGYGILLSSSGGSVTADITGAWLTAAGTGGDAYGIGLNAYNSIYASITGNDLTGGVSGVGDTHGVYGIYLHTESGDIGGIDANPLTISNNSLGGAGVISSAGNAYGIYLVSAGDIGASGAIPVFSGNTVLVNASGGIGYGITEYADEDLYGSITGGTITARGLTALGVDLYGGDYIGGSTSPFTISGATINAISSSNAATYGIRFFSDGYLYASIYGSSITATSAGGTAEGVYGYGYNGIFGSIYGSVITASGGEAYGIDLRADGSIGGSSDPFDISWSSITATGSSGIAYGIYEYTNNGDLFESITGGSITAGGYGDTYGAYLGSLNGSIGGSTSPFTISGVTINATGTDNTYGLAILAGNDIYAEITNSPINATAANGTAYGVYESAYNSLFGSISGRKIDVSGVGACGVYLESVNGSIGGSGSYFTVSGATIDATSTGGATAIGISSHAGGHDVYALFTDNTITATAEDYIAVGVYGYASGGIYGSISGGTITAFGLMAEGIELYGGDYIGSSTSPFTISGATIDATANGTYVNGIRFFSDGYLYASIENSSITATIAGGTAEGVYGYGYNGVFGSISDSTIIARGGEAYGINLSADGSIGGSSSPFVISGNTISAIGSSGIAYGIYEHTNSGDLYSGITGGSITARGVGAYGVYLESAGGSIGGSGGYFTVSDAAIRATSTGAANAIGIYAYSYVHDVYALFTDNIITATAEDYIAAGVYGYAPDGIYGSISGGSITASGLTAVGVDLYGEDYIGGSTSPFTISGATIDATSSSDAATYGIRFFSDGYLYASIDGGSITATSAGGTAEGVFGYGYNGIFGNIYNSTITASGGEAYGIDLRADGSIGGSSDPFDILWSSITATGSSGIACGIYEYTNNGDLFESITGGTITAGAYANSYGVYLRSTNGSIGSSTSPSTISRVTVNATGTKNSHGFVLTAGNDIYAEITNNGITAAAPNGTAYGVYESAYNNLFGRISGREIITSGSTAYGIHLGAENGNIGSLSDPFTVSRISIDATSTGDSSDAFGVYMSSNNGYLHATIEHPYIVATAEDGIAYGVYEIAHNDIFGSISDGTITANGNGAYGVYLRPIYGGLGDSTNPFTISDVTIAARASDLDGFGVFMSSYNDLHTAISNCAITTAAPNGTAYGVYDYSNNSIYGSISGGTITVNGNDAYGVYESVHHNIYGAISDVTINASGNTAYGISLECDYSYFLDTGYVGSSTNPFTISDTTINATGTGDTYGLRISTTYLLYAFIDGNNITSTSLSGSAFGIYEKVYGSSYGDIYSYLDGNNITATAEDASAYGVYETSYNSIYGSISGGTITARGGTDLYGVYLFSENSSIGSSGDYFTISDATIEATGTGTGTADYAYGVLINADVGDIYAHIEDNYITVGESTGDVNAYGIYEIADGAIYGSISGGTITARGGTDLYGVYLFSENSSIGSSGDYFTISDATINVTGTGKTDSAYGVQILTRNNIYAHIQDNIITVEGTDIIRAYGVYEIARNDIIGSISGGTITANGLIATGIHLQTFYSSIGSSTNPFTISGTTINATGLSGDAYGLYAVAGSAIIANLTGNTALITGDLARYFMYLNASGSGTSAIGWTGNSYTPSGGPWSGNYDTTGFTTNGPVYLYGITDPEITP